MNELSNKTLNLINNIIDVGQLFNVEVFIMDKHGIRAKSDEAYIFLVQEENFDFLEFDSLCISRVSDLKTRMKFMESSSGKSGFKVYAAETKTLDSGDVIVSKLRFMSQKTSIELTADNGAKHKLPRNIKEEPMVSFTIDHNSIEVLSALPRAIQNKNKALTIEGVDGVIVASSRDVHRDYVNHILSETPKYTGDTTNFSFVYNLTNLIPMIRGRMGFDITLTPRGLMLAEINGIRIIIFPEKIAN